MAATETGVWDLQDVRDKQLAGEWTYDGARELYTAGYNIYGQLGLNHRDQRSSPTQIPGTTWSKVSSQNARSYGIKTDGSLWAWGKNEQGELGQNIGGNPGRRSSPVQVGTDTTWSHVSTGSNSVSAIKTDGTLWVWGSNYGNLGLNQPGADNNFGRARSSPTQVGTDSNWGHSEFTGTGSQFGIKTDGTLWAWGYNTKGQLGLNTPQNQYSSPTQVGTDTTWSTNELHWGTAQNISNYAIKTDGTLWSWGYNGFGQLGQNQAYGNDRSSPVQIPGSWQSVGNAGNSGMAIKTDGTMWSWGNGAFGSLANGSSGNPNRRSSPIQVGTDTDWSYMARGGQNNQTAIKTDGTLYNCGRNESGDLGHNNASTKESMTQIPGIFTGKPSGEQTALWIKQV